MENKKEYISNQICVYKTNKKLIEFKDKLKFANTVNYAHIHSFDEKDSFGRNVISNIGIVLQDYSLGKGEKMVRAEVNISPDDLKFIFTKLLSGEKEFDFAQEKIFGTPDSDGKSSVTKLMVKRASVGPDGKIRNYPWFVQVENGKGIAIKADGGGTYIKPQSYTTVKKVFININDRDMFKLLNRATQYIEVWEKYYGTLLLDEMIKLKSLLSEETAS